MDAKKPHIRLTPEVSLMLRRMKELDSELDCQWRYILALINAIKITTNSFNEDLEVLFEHVFDNEVRRRTFDY